MILSKRNGSIRNFNGGFYRSFHSKFILFRLKSLENYWCVDIEVPTNR